jgi:hypothetical protein
MLDDAASEYWVPNTPPLPRDFAATLFKQVEEMGKKPMLIKYQSTNWEMRVDMEALLDTALNVGTKAIAKAERERKEGSPSHTSLLPQVSSNMS